jgi:hypothetical protein
VGDAEFTERIHIVGTKPKPDVPSQFAKLLEQVVETFPLASNRRVSQLAIVLLAVI